MHNWTKCFTVFATLAVVLSLALGLTMVGCSDKDRDSSGTKFVDITYRFAQVITPGKATSQATKAILTAYNATGASVYTDQDETTIAKHKNVTPASTVGSSYYEGTAAVLTTATKLMLTYYDTDGKEVGTQDVKTVSALKDGALVDFTTADATVAWTPADANITLAINGSAVTVAAKDEEGSALTVTLTSEDTEHITINEAGNAITGKAVTKEPVTVTATAKDTNQQTVGTKNYSVTVTSTPTVVTWDPAETDITLEGGSGIVISAKDENETELTVSLASDDTEHIEIYDNEIAGIGNTDEPVTVTATAKDNDGNTMDTKTYSVNVIPPVDWAPYRTQHAIAVGGELVISAEQGGVALDVTLTSDDTEHITIEGTTITGKATFDEAIEVTATAKDVQGNVVGTRIYSIKVYEE